MALERGYEGLRATGDTSWLKNEGWSDVVNYENKIDSVIEKHQMIALCPYHLAHIILRCAMQPKLLI